MPFDLSRRRAFGLILAAPAVVRASSLMRMPRPERLLAPMAREQELMGPSFARKRDMYLTLTMVTREAVLLWANSNEFARNCDSQYHSLFLPAQGPTLHV